MAHQVLAQTSSRTLSGHRRVRWHEITLKRSNGSYVARIMYRTTVDGERDERTYYKCDDWSELARLVRGYDPMAHVHVTHDDERPLMIQLHESWTAALGQMFNATGREPGTGTLAS
jgi:hypothetical protein